MDDWELIFTILGETSTTKITKDKEAIGFNENKIAAKQVERLQAMQGKSQKKKQERVFQLKITFWKFLKKRRKNSYNMFKTYQKV